MRVQVRHMHPREHTATHTQQQVGVGAGPVDRHRVLQKHQLLREHADDGRSAGSAKPSAKRARKEKQGGS
jgi:hypothetical protein